MNIHLLLILTLIFGITPNLGFFNLSSFFFVLVFGIVAWIILRNPPLVKEDSRVLQWGILFVFLISAFFYGGLYQDIFTRLIGQAAFFIFCIYLFTKIFRKKEVASYVFVVFFIFLSLLTIYGSPKPVVDSFVILKEAPQKLLHGQNPYNSVYSRVYKNINPDYFNYLPFSIIYFLPFVALLNDPRYGLILAMIGTYILLNKFQKKNTPQKYLYSSLFLFAPRSFYMIEHAYLDTLIFFLFVLALYFQEKKKYNYFSIILSGFFLLKQNMAILLPLFIKKIFQKKETVILFIAPFLSVLLFFLWNPQSFIRNIITVNQPNGLIMQGAPFQMSITIPNILYQLFNIPIASMQLVFTICAIFALVIAICIFLDKRLTSHRKIILILFFGYFFSYHAFFNSYYLVLLFLIFDFVLSKKLY